jgi:N6-adenosine-specific RNA methylase IME4
MVDNAVAADAAPWATRISESWGNVFQAVIDTGRALIEAKAALPHGAFESMIESDLPFGSRTAQRIMKIACDPRITNPTHVSVLPPQWGALYELTRLDDTTFAAAVGDGRISPDMERSAAAMLARGDSRARRLSKAEAGAAGSTPLHVPRDGQDFAAAVEVPLPARKYAVICADPPWKQETYSDRGREKSADMHYPVMTLDALMALPVEEIASENCALFLWTFPTHLPQALDLMAAWGFDYRTKCSWFKTTGAGGMYMGTGFWFRDCGEDLLLGIRGDMPAPMPGTQAMSIQAAPVGRHSEKPALFRNMIDSYFPGVAKVELFARDPAPGWDAWGNEVGFVDGSGQEGAS